MIIEHPYINGKIKIDKGCIDLRGSFELQGVREPEKLQEFIELISKQKNPVLLDVGACTGSYSLLPTINESLTVYAFEPTSKSFEYLNKNLDIHGLLDNKVFTFNMAVSNYTGQGKFHTVKADSCKALSMLGGKPAWHKDTFESIVKVISIDDFCESRKVIPTAIKIDTEGNELNVLKGAVKTIKKYRPIISCECNDENTMQYGYNTKELAAFFKQHKYRFNIQNADLLAMP